MTLWTTLGWIVWGTLFVVSALLSFDLFYRPLSENRAYSTAFGAMVFFWWISLGWAYYYGAFNKLHLFWLAPLASVVATHILSAGGANHSFFLQDTYSVSFFVLAFGWLILLWRLTPYFLVCPECGSFDCRRSARKNLCERLYGLARARPFRCRSCNRRFWRFGRRFPMKTSF
jgi:hypothetical protein